MLYQRALTSLTAIKCIILKLHKGEEKNPIVSSIGEEAHDQACSDYILKKKITKRSCLQLSLCAWHFCDCNIEEKRKKKSLQMFPDSERHPDEHPGARRPRWEWFTLHEVPRASLQIGATAQGVSSGGRRGLVSPDGSGCPPAAPHPPWLCSPPSSALPVAGLFLGSGIFVDLLFW